MSLWCLLSEYHTILYILIFVFILSVLYSYDGQMKVEPVVLNAHRKMIDCVEPSDSIIGTATSGKVFTGIKVAEYNRSSLLFNRVTKQTDLSIFRTKTRIESIYNQTKCDRWGVVTSIHPPTAAIERQVRLHSWCLVVVADKNGPEVYEMPNPAVSSTTPVGHYVYLTVAKQIVMETEFPMLKLLPWNHFGRKNVGYLYAIANGAKVIWDFDDDNMLISKHHVFQVPGLLNEVTNTSHVMMNSAHGHLDGNVQQHHDHTSFSGVEPQAFTGLVLNPYELLGANVDPSWPRGFPLENIKPELKASLIGMNKASSSSKAGLSPATPTQGSIIGIAKDPIPTVPIKLKASEIGVIHYLSNHEPDVDAVYKLTQPLPLDFPMRGSPPLIVPKGVFAPYNTQSTMILYNSFWSLLLPISVHSRISDIYRSYMTQKISVKYNLRLAIHPPIVTHVHTQRDLLHDLHNETPLFLHVHQLLLQLQQWKSSTASMVGEIEELVVFMYEHGYLSIEDVELTQAWLISLINLDYKFPDAASA